MGSERGIRPGGPIFLAGTDRSGIGLLAETLNAHPRLFLSRRTRFWDLIYGQYGDVKHPASEARAIAAMGEQPHMLELNPDAERLHSDFVAIGDNRDYAALFRLIHEHHLESITMTRWGDKTLDSDRHAAVILGAYPNAQMIHVVRDPRDRYASQLMHRNASRGKVGAGSAIWLASVRRAKRNRTAYEGRYEIVRYEDVVLDPEETLRAVCRFLGEDFSESMLEVSGPPQRLGARAGKPFGRSRLVPTSVGRYKSDLTGEDIAFVQLVAARPMRALGYVTSRVRLSRQRRIAFWLLAVPVNLIRMGAWWVRMSLRRTSR